MRIHIVFANCDWVISYFFTFAVILSHYHGAYHPPCLPYIELRGEMVAIFIFVLRISPLEHLVSKRLWHSWVMAYKVKHSFCIVKVILEYFFSSFITAVRIFPVGSDHISRKPSAIVDVCLIVWHFRPYKTTVQVFWRLYIEEPEHEFIPCRVVILRFRNLYHIRRIISESDPEIVCLNVFATSSMLSHFSRHYAIEQSA